MSASWHDVVRRVHPQATDGECDVLLWECSCFPFGTLRQTWRGLRDIWERGGRTVSGAVALSYAELDRAMSQISATPDEGTITDTATEPGLSARDTGADAAGHTESIADTAGDAGHTEQEGET
jgi:hypothetical protein